MNYPNFSVFSRCQIGYSACSCHIPSNVLANLLPYSIKYSCQFKKSFCKIKNVPVKFMPKLKGILNALTDP